MSQYNDIKDCSDCHHPVTASFARFYLDNFHRAQTLHFIIFLLLHTQTIIDMINPSFHLWLPGDQNVICCVLDAHTDFINQGAISLAKQFDPDGHRTLAAITKIDCANHHTIAKHISDLNLDFVLVRAQACHELCINNVLLIII